MSSRAKILEAYFNLLIARLSESKANRLSQLHPIRTALASIYERGMTAETFLRNLVELAVATIQVRKNPGGITRLQDLPIPPYDLWLPFLARSSQVSGNGDLTNTDADADDVSGILKKMVVDLTALVSPYVSHEPEEPPVPQVRQTVFISYSHLDMEYHRSLKNIMEPALSKYSDVVCFWDDTQIKPGDLWPDAIRHALNAATIAILLVSSDYLNSTFIMTEEAKPFLEKARNGGLKLLWISVRPHLHEHTPFASYHCLNRPDRPLSGFNQSQREEEMKEICRCIFKELGISAQPFDVASRAS